MGIGILCIPNVINSGLAKIGTEIKNGPDKVAKGNWIFWHKIGFSGQKSDIEAKKIKIG